MKINRVLIYGNNPMANIYAHKLLHSMNFITIYDSSNMIKSKDIIYKEKNMINNRLKVINDLKEDDFYDLILITKLIHEDDKFIKELLNNKSRIIMFDGLRVDATRISDKINSIDENKLVLFSYSKIKAANYYKVTENFIDDEQIIIGHANKEIDDETREKIEEIFSKPMFSVKYDNMDAYLKNVLCVLLPIYFATCKVNGKIEFIDKYTTWMTMAAMDEALLALQKKCVKENDEVVKYVRNKTKLLFYLYLRYNRKNKNYKHWINYEINENIENIIELNIAFRNFLEDVIPLKNWRNLERYLKEKYIHVAHKTTLRTK